VIYEALVFNEREHLISSEFTTASLNLGRSYNILGRFSEAVSVLKDAVTVAKDSEIIRALPELLNQLSFAYNNTGESSAAYETLLEADSIKDLLSHQHAEELMSDLEIKHKEEIFFKEQEGKSKELALASKRHSELLIWLCVLGFLLCYIVILYVAKRKKNLLLVQQNLKLAGATRNLKKEPNLKIVASKVSIELKEKIQEALEKKKMFTESSLSLERFSKRISSNRTYVSEGINEVYAASFRSVINKMRVEEARSLLIDPDFENYSIEGIAITVGYRNISSFNSAFKRETGITPSYFKKSYLRSIKSMV
jgi:YesN/AraC family two-component response regulator